MTKLGDEKTVYSYARERVQEYEATCVGFTPKKEPVWYFQTVNRDAGFEINDRYIIFDTIGDSQGFYETVEEVFAHMGNLADLREVQATHLRANIDAAEVEWKEKEERKKAIDKDD